MSRIALMPDDDGEKFDQTELHPQQLARGQAYDARTFMGQVRAGKGLRFPWTDVDAMVGPLLPGWLVAVGGRAKAGKTTMLMQLLTAWTDIGKTVVYVGTETSVAHLRYVWGATRCNVPIDQAIDPDCPEPIYERIMADVEQVQTAYAFASRAIFADSPEATVGDLTKWTEYGAQYGAHAVVFDHFSRLEVPAGDRWQGLSDAIRQIKKLAVAANLTIVTGAQLTPGGGDDVLGEHEVPGNGSWAGSKEVQREVDVGLQLWRPFKTGITSQQKHEAKGDMAKVREIVQPGAMAVRLSAHRWGKEANTFCRLYVEQGHITGWSAR